MEKQLLINMIALLLLLTSCSSPDYAVDVIDESLWSDGPEDQIFYGEGNVSISAGNLTLTDIHAKQNDVVIIIQ